jgi:putative redox protein
MNTVHSASENPNEFAQIITVRGHTFRADVGTALGSTDAGPGPHDLFDAALAACKTLTAVWYARRQGWPLERVEAHVESDESEERKGRYVMNVRLQFHGPLTQEQRDRLYAAAGKCPVHKLMTDVEVIINTLPLEAP